MLIRDDEFQIILVVISDLLVFGYICVALISLFY
jgi:hypothetical protein